jgi:hypothetical protein
MLDLLLRSSWVQITDALKKDKSAEKRFTVNSNGTISICTFAISICLLTGQALSGKFADQTPCYDLREKN